MSILSLAKRFRRSRPQRAGAAPAGDHEAAVPAAARAAAQLPFDLIPLLSEKSMRLQESGTVAFRVPARATKEAVAQAVRWRYKVEPVAVRVLLVPPKVRRRGRTQGLTPVWKKAYVTVKDVQALGIQP